MPDQKNSKTPAQNDPLRIAALQESTEVMQGLGTSVAGLTEEEAAARLVQYGPNEVAREKRQNWLMRLYVAARNPLVILLTILAIISFVAPQGDAITGIIMLVMVG